MTRIIFTSLMLLSTGVRAQEIKMTCVTEFPTTSYFIRETDKKVVVEIFHHNGTEYSVVSDGLVTPHDLPLINQRAQWLTALGTFLRFEWPREKCEVQGDMLFSCMSFSEPQIINGHKVRSWSVYTTLESQQSFAGTYEYRRLNVGIEVDGQTVPIAMKYAANECHPEAYFDRLRSMKK